MKRNPNQYGTIQFLGPNRARPWAVYTPRRRQTDGTRRRTLIGYYATNEEARGALADWNRTRGSKSDYTLQDLYNEWSRKAYTDLSKSTADCYRAAWRHLEDLHKLRVREIKTGHFQDVIDMLAPVKSWSTLHNISVLAGLLEKYAIQYDIIDKNYASFIQLPTEPKKEKEIFTADQLLIIEDAAARDFMWARPIMILIYTGWRISELLDLEICNYDSVASTLQGGCKTENGKNRLVPVHDRIKPYVDAYAAQGGPRLICRESNGKLLPITPNYCRKFLFGPTLEALGVRRSDGEAFTPHATRHTFASLARKDGVDPLVTKKLMGHSPKADVTERVYTHVDVDMLMEGMKLIRSKNEN